MAALGCPVAKFIVKLKHGREIRPACRLHDTAVIFRSFLCEAVGTVVLKLVGKIAACNKHSPASQSFYSLFYVDSKPVMIGKGLT